MATFERARINGLTVEGEKFIVTFSQKGKQIGEEASPIEKRESQKELRVNIRSVSSFKCRHKTKTSFKNIPPGEFSKTAVMHRGWVFYGYPLYPLKSSSKHGSREIHVDIFDKKKNETTARRKLSRFQ